MNGIFLTGTDTGCGKTRVGVALAGAARAQGLRVRVLKPVETGCEERNGALVPADAIRLAEAAEDRRELDLICPYRLRVPAAPDVAARKQGVEIDPARIEKLYREAAAQADLVLIEGAGGLLVPLGPGLDMAGLARRSGWPLLLVARARLGTLNHTLLSLEAARTRGLRVLGVVVSQTTPELPDAERANLEGLLARLPVPFLGELPFGGRRLVPELDPGALLASLARA